MKLQRTLAVTRKVLRTLKHDRRTFAFLILMPVIMISLFGYTFGGDVKNIPVQVVNLDKGVGNLSLAKDIINDISTRDTLRIVQQYDSSTSVEASIDAVRKGEAWATIVFPENFTADMLSSVYNICHGLPYATVRFLVYDDATNTNIAKAVYSDASQALQSVIMEKYQMVSPAAVQENRIYGENARFIDTFAPGVMGLAAMMVTFMLSIISFVHERSTSTLDRLLSTPATEGDIVAGYALGFGLVALIQSSVVLLTAVVLFQVTILGSPLLVLLIIFLLGIGMQGLGFLLSSNAKNEFQAIQFLPIILFPSILLAGVFWPIEAVPEILQPISYLIPLTYAVDGMRSVMMRGWDLSQIWPSAAVLAAFAASMLLLSVYSLRRRR